MSETPRYKAKGQIYLFDRLLEDGEAFASELVPGKAWQPVNAAAEAAVAARSADLTKRGAVVLAPSPAAFTDTSEVEDLRQELAGAKADVDNLTSKLEAQADALANANTLAAERLALLDFAEAQIASLQTELAAAEETFEALVAPAAT